MKAKLTINHSEKSYDVDIQKEMYATNKALALIACDEYEPFAYLSVNLSESDSLPKNQCYFKNYSENEGLLEQLEEQGIVKRLGPMVQTDFVMVPLVEVLF